MKIQLLLFKLLRKQNVTDGRTDTHMDGRTDNVKTVYPTTNKVCGGYSYFYEIRITFIYFVYVSREEVDRLIKW